MDEESDMEFEESSNTSISRLSSCEVCNVKEAIYTCPKCSVKTCCLKCVNIHKKELECNGVRDKVKFIYLNNFNNLDMLSDYKLLEESSRFVYTVKKNHDKRFTTFNRDLPPHQYRLKGAARKRGTIIMFLLENFTRHKINSTRLNYKLDRIFWRIEWVFVNAHSGIGKFSDQKCDEDIRIAKLLDKYFDPVSTEIDAKENLAFYHAAGLSGCRFFLRAERVKNCSKKFHELDARLSLKENLAGKCIIEFPIVYVVLKDHSYDFSIVNSDDEDENVENSNNDSLLDNTVTATGNTNAKGSFTAMFARQQKLQIENEMLENQKKEPKNYLFTTGYSSDEENVVES